MSITLEEIRHAFEDAFDGDSSPLDTDYLLDMDTGKIDICAVFRKIKYRTRWFLVADLKTVEHPHMNFEKHTETLVLNLPTICKMVLDQNAANERLKAEIEHLNQKLKYPNVKLGLRVRYQGNIYEVVGCDAFGKTHLITPTQNDGDIDVYCQWSECEVIE